ncbi:MAG: zinc ABC transporter substrate-binding protein [Chloroflexi bacterium]|nr:zinc ABC transporter substrate-binding protein [Chloroflexota bacterium]
MIQTIKKAFPAGVLALSLFALMILVACSDGATEPAPPQQAAAPTTAPAATAAPTVAPTVAPTPEPEPLTIVTTMSITADWISNIGGDRVNVVSLLPAGADPHLYQPTPRDVATVAEADLVLPVGLGLEASWLDDLLHTAAADESAIVALAELVDPIPFEDPHAGAGMSLANAVLDVVHEVEDGHISADEGLHEIHELIEHAMEEEEAHDHGHGHGEEEHWEDHALELIEQAEAGQYDVMKAIEEIDHIVHESGEAMAMDHDDHGHEDEHDGHGESLVAAILHVAHEVKDGHISADEGIHEIHELMEAAEEEAGHDHAHEEEWEHEIHEIVAQAEAGELDAMKAIEEIDHIAHEEMDGHDEHDAHDDHDDHGEALAMDILDVVHEVEDGHISAEEGVHEIEHLMEAAEEEEGHAHEEDWEHEIHEILEQAEAGQFDAMMTIEEIDHVALEVVGDHDDHDDHGHDDHHGHDHGEFDPHFWHDLVRVQVALTDVAVRLSVLDPAGADTYMANATAYNAELDELHHWSEEQLGTIPEDHRLLVTTHEAFGYFAHVYDFKVVGTILPWTTEVEPTPAEIAELSDDIEAYGVSAIFSETTISDRVAKAIADETGISLHSLYSESLAADGEASTYIGMFRANVNTIVEALK